MTLRLSGKRICLATDMSRRDHPVDDIGNRGSRYAQTLAHVPGSQRRSGCLRHDHMQQGVEVVVADVMHVGKDAADAVGTSRDGSNVRGEARSSSHDRRLRE